MLRFLWEPYHLQRRCIYFLFPSFDEEIAGNVQAYSRADQAQPPFRLDAPISMCGNVQTTRTGFDGIS